MNYKDYYAILGVPKNSAEKDVKSAYRKLARKWHPDANPDNQRAAEEKFKDIQEAYEVLGDPEKRKKYDVLGSDWQNAAREAERQRSYRHYFAIGYLMRQLQQRFQYVPFTTLRPVDSAS